MKDLFLEGQEAFNQQKLVIIPTETVFGLSAPIDREDLLEKIFTLKNRPKNNPLIVHCSSLEMVKSLVKNLPPWALLLAKKFWPGPLTLLLPKPPEISPLISSTAFFGVRIPNNPLTLGFIDFLKTPLAAPSANEFTFLSPTQHLHLEEGLLKKYQNDLYVLGAFSNKESCEIGIESTILMPSQESENILLILREGILDKEELEKALIDSQYKVKRETQKKEQIFAPGNYEKHYAPKTPLILIFASENYSLPEHLNLAEYKKVFPIEIEKGPLSTAKELYATLHRMDKDSSCQKILYIFPKKLESHLKWQAVLDRLKRASSEIMYL